MMGTLIHEKEHVEIHKKVKADWRDAQNTDPPDFLLNAIGSNNLVGIQEARSRWIQYGLYNSLSPVLTDYKSHLTLDEKQLIELQKNIIDDRKQIFNTDISWYSPKWLQEFYKSWNFENESIPSLN